MTYILIGLVVVYALGGVGFWYSQQYNKNKVRYKRLKLVDDSIEFNRKAKTKEDFIKMYVSLREQFAVSMNVTKDEFEKLSIESIRKMNEEALLSIRDNLMTK